MHSVISLTKIEDFNRKLTDTINNSISTKKHQKLINKKWVNLLQKIRNKKLPIKWLKDQSRQIYKHSYDG